MCAGVRKKPEPLKIKVDEKWVKKLH
jgi:hypothetical protein